MYMASNKFRNFESRERAYSSGHVDRHGNPPQYRMPDEAAAEEPQNYNGTPFIRTNSFVGAHYRNNQWANAMPNKEEIDTNFNTIWAMAYNEDPRQVEFKKGIYESFSELISTQYLEIMYNTNLRHDPLIKGVFKYAAEWTKARFETVRGAFSITDFLKDLEDEIRTWCAAVGERLNEFPRETERRIQVAREELRNRLQNGIDNQIREQKTNFGDMQQTRQNLFLSLKAFINNKILRRDWVNVREYYEHQFEEMRAESVENAVRELNAESDEDEGEGYGRGTRKKHKKSEKYKRSHRKAKKTKKSQKHKRKPKKTKRQYKRRQQ